MCRPHTFTLRHPSGAPFTLLGRLPGGLVIRTWRFHCCGLSSISGRGTKIPRAVRRSQKKKDETTVLEVIYMSPRKHYIWGFFSQVQLLNNSAYFLVSLFECSVEKYLTSGVTEYFEGKKKLNWALRAFAKVICFKVIVKTFPGFGEIMRNKLEWRKRKKHFLT